MTFLNPIRHLFPLLISLVILSHPLQGADDKSWNECNPFNKKDMIDQPAINSSDTSLLLSPSEKKFSVLSAIKNPYIMLGTSAIIALAFGGGSYAFHQQYPNYEATAQELGQEAFNTMVNRTHLDGPWDWGIHYPGLESPIPPYFHNCLEALFGCRYGGPKPHSEGYKCDPNEDWKAGTIHDWINVVMSQCGCSFDFWNNYVYLLINGTDPNPYNMVCNLNPDNNSICCGNVWGVDSHKKFGFPPNTMRSKYAIRIIRGDALEAQNATREEYILAHWTATFTAIWGTGTFATIMPFVLMGMACLI